MSSEDHGNDNYRYKRPITLKPIDSLPIAVKRDDVLNSLNIMREYPSGAQLNTLKNNIAKAQAAVVDVEDVVEMLPRLEKLIPERN